MQREISFDPDLQQQQLCLSPLKLTMFQLIMLLCFQVVHSKQRILYVKSSSQCSDDVIECHTLDWYSNNSKVSFTSNTIMLFDKGTHFMNTFIKVSNCHSFTMAGEGNATRESSGLPQPTSVISCTGASSGGLFFSNSSNIRIKHILFYFVQFSFAGSHVFYSVSLASMLRNSMILS